MNILDNIVARKRQEIAAQQERVSVQELEKAPLFGRPCYSFRANLTGAGQSGIIAEFKRRSPSKGIINDQADVVATTAGYARAGASALSILTDTDFFGGTPADVIAAREGNPLPILRKDFMVDTYQVLEAKAMGADVILLIAASLRPDEVKHLAGFARSLGLEVLLEVHDRDELERSVCPEVDAVGVNNRNLKDFTVNVGLSEELAEFIPDEFVKVSESGISDPATVVALQQYGYRGFLMGENFMKHPQPAEACSRFIAELRAQEALAGSRRRQARA
jgi:indole-3-glycerol phosphate synthase